MVGNCVEGLCKLWVWNVGPAGVIFNEEWILFAAVANRRPQSTGRKCRAIKRSFPAPIEQSLTGTMTGASSSTSCGSGCAANRREARSRGADERALSIGARLRRLGSKAAGRSVSPGGAWQRGVGGPPSGSASALAIETTALPAPRHPKARFDRWSALSLPGSTAASGLVIALLGLAVAACTPKEPDTARLPPATDQASVRYDSTLSEGIKFWLPGVPSMVLEFAGIAPQESWGRWTVGPTALIRFDGPLPPDFTLLVTAAAYGPNIGRPVRFSSGGVEQSAVFSVELGKAPPEEKRLRFVSNTPTDTIEIRVPHPQAPGNGDRRAIGIALIRLRVQAP